MWKNCRDWLAEKIDVKITGYISIALFAIYVGALGALIVLSVQASGMLPLWAAYGGFGIILGCVLAILLARWGQRQTGRRLKANRIAVWMNGCLIGLMVLIYLMGVLIMVR